MFPKCIFLVFHNNVTGKFLWQLNKDFFCGLGFLENLLENVFSFMKALDNSLFLKYLFFNFEKYVSCNLDTQFKNTSGVFPRLFLLCLGSVGNQELTKAVLPRFLKFP